MTTRSGISGRLLYGNCVNDITGMTYIKGRKHPKVYEVWNTMIARCFSEKEKLRLPTYRNVTCCEEWKKFSNFKRWFDENYVHGYELDKDILAPGNLIYSPETCVFVPRFLNVLLLDRCRDRGPYPLGVNIAHNGKYKAKFSFFGKTKHIGYFETPDLAFDAYKEAKSNHVINIAKDYQDERVSNALVRHAEIISKFGSVSYLIER